MEPVLWRQCQEQGEEAAPPEGTDRPPGHACGSQHRQVMAKAFLS